MVLSMLALWVTVATGVVVLAFWFPEDPAQEAARPVSLAVGHIALAISAVVSWTLYVILKRATLAGASAALLAATVTAGVTTLQLTRGRSRRPGSTPQVGAPGPALVLHGALAGVGVVAVVLVLGTR